MILRIYVGEVFEGSGFTADQRAAHVELRINWNSLLLPAHFLEQGSDQRDWWTGPDGKTWRAYLSVQEFRDIFRNDPIENMVYLCSLPHNANIDGTLEEILLSGKIVNYTDHARALSKNIYAKALGYE